MWCRTWGLVREEAGCVLLARNKAAQDASYTYILNVLQGNVLYRGMEAASIASHCIRIRSILLEREQKQ